MYVSVTKAAIRDATTDTPVVGSIAISVVTAELTPREMP
jgi:hypothetical protein